MTIGTTYKVYTGTLRITAVPKGKDNIYTLWYEADNNAQYSREVQMTRDYVKRLKQ